MSSHLPRELNFELSSRSNSRQLRVLLSTVLLVCLLLAGFLLCWLNERRIQATAQLHSLHLQIEATSADRQRQSQVSPKTWQADADEARRLMGLTLDDRLLAVERCIEQGAKVTELRHDESLAATTTSVQLPDDMALAPLVECLNSGLTAIDAKWIVRSVTISAPSGLKTVQLLVEPGRTKGLK